MATVSRIYSKFGVLSAVMLMGLLGSLFFACQIFWHVESVESNALLSSSVSEQENNTKLYPMSKVLGSVKDTVIRPLPAAPLAAAEAAAVVARAPQPHTASQLLVPPAAAQCAAVGPFGRVYAKVSIR
jgi:hypothetical protein